MNKIISLDFQEEIKKENLASSFSLGGLVMAVSFVVFASISGEYAGSLLKDILITVIYFVISLILMTVFYFIFEYLIFRRVKLSKEILENNLSASLLIGSIFIAGSLITIVVMG